MSLNVCVVRGTCSSPAEIRVLPSGQTLVLVQLTSRTDAGTTTVPVVMTDPPAFVESLDTGDEVVVLGRCRRRFFRAGAGTGSRVEVEAGAVAPARDRRRVHALVRRATAALADLAH